MYTTQGMSGYQPTQHSEKRSSDKAEMRTTWCLWFGHTFDPVSRFPYRCSPKRPKGTNKSFLPLTPSLFPADIWCQNDAVSTSMRRDHVASTLIRRHFHTRCPLGSYWLYCSTVFIILNVSLILLTNNLRHNTGKGRKGLLRKELWCPADLARLWNRIDARTHIKHCRTKPNFSVF